jgi:hypothetical protein
MTMTYIPGITTRMEEVKQMLEDDNQLRKAIVLHPADLYDIYYLLQDPKKNLCYLYIFI